MCGTRGLGARIASAQSAHATSPSEDRPAAGRRRPGSCARSARWRSRAGAGTMARSSNARNEISAARSPGRRGAPAARAAPRRGAGCTRPLAGSRPGSASRAARAPGTGVGSAGCAAPAVASHQRSSHAHQLRPRVPHDLGRVAVVRRHLARRDSALEENSGSSSGADCTKPRATQRKHIRAQVPSRPTAHPWKCG